ncbi:SBBP repeat-containing protein [Flavivirga amylovorans]|uniref:SBBP repeat-containing protein n=1 Tax=Flavivirga amylovorans TaxID=870486 RepID=A0ABT8X525_9FLAO|nr:SBBP repeat-containing protein [Flavivirga amylovorans]MDO5989086.1 SBBP repeat-containing protein [Flavivirga amylovorans]
MKTKLLGLLIVVLITFGTTNAQNHVWATTLDEDLGRSIKIDALNNVYTVGTTQAGPGTDRGIFIRKQDSNGIQLWIKYINGTGDDQPLALALDNNANVLVTGYFNFQVDFDPGSSVFNMSASARNQNVFILKLDTDGDFVWARQISGPSGDFGKGITSDSAGNVYTTGFFKGTVDFDPGTSTTNLTANGTDPNTSDIFIQKLNASGDFVWAVNMGAGNNDEGTAIKTDTSGNVYTTGYFDGTVDFNPDPDPTTGVYNLSTGGGRNAFIQKLDSSGNFIWAKAFLSSSGQVYSFAMDVDGSENVYTTGYFKSTADFDPGTGTFNMSSFGGGNDIFIVKLDTTGDFVWAKHMGRAGSDVGRGISVDNSGNVYTAGSFGDTCDFDPGAGTENMTPAGGLDIFIQKLDAAGDYEWAIRIGEVLNDVPLAIEVKDSNIYTTGYYEGTVDFDPNTGVANLTSMTSRDAFTHKLELVNCTVNIPDANFKSYLVGDMTINTNGDTEIQCGEASAYTGWISVANTNISDLTGIEAFTNITKLFCNGNSLTSLNLTLNPLLDQMNANDNDLVQLDISSGGNTNMGSGWFSAGNNPNLTCIQVDNVAYSNTNWMSSIDSQTSFSTNCSSLGVNDSTLENIAIYPNPVTHTLIVQLEEGLERIDIFTVQGQKIIESYKKQVDVSQLSTGIYLLKIYSNSGKIGVKRFIKN